jgi:deoxyribodipyrimidine photo-lyase
LPSIPVDPGRIPTIDDLDLDNPTFDENRQNGGTSAGMHLLNSFLGRRHRKYRTGMSSPNSAYIHCSRLSPHLAWGTLSLREVYQSVQDEIESRPSPNPNLQSFQSRLWWHGHFIQKLEDAPRIEHESFIPDFDHLRDSNQNHLDMWARGQTGYPIVDACMRALYRTGYLNFRMRALVTSFAAHNLWMPWQDFQHLLARRWVDYHPGIHIPQIQMQSVTTGINQIRVYNPVKQSQEQDPDGEFIRTWIPSLQHVEAPYIHEPWKMPQPVQREVGCTIRDDYPAPIVDHKKTAKKARDRIQDKRQCEEIRRQAKAIMERHGSRRDRPTRSAPQDRSDQQTLFE